MTAAGILRRLSWRSARAAGAAAPALDEARALGAWSVHPVDVRRGEVVRIQCHAGELLVTCEGDRQDHILGEGQVVQVERRGRVVVVGLRPSVVRVCRRRRSMAA